MSKIILIDMDDTIENLIDSWILWLNSKHNLNYKPSDITTWDISSIIKELSLDEIREPLSTREFWKNISIKKDSIEYLNKLKNIGCELYLVTSSYCNTIQYKYEEVIKKYFNNIFNWEHIIIAYNKQLIKGDYLIDDSPKNLVGGDYKKILIDCYHNKNFNESDIGAIRVYDWKQIYEIIKKDLDK